ncbi:MAG TPA: hydrogenase maturation protease [Candidatus Limnocylindrales bacterium]
MDGPGPTDRAAVGEGPARRIVVIGLGNPLLGDDGVGWRVVEAVEAALGPVGLAERVAIDRLAVGGLRLMEHLVDVDRAILVDARSGPDEDRGRVRVEPFETAPDAAAHASSSHDASLAVALAVGAAFGARLPAELTLVTVETGPSFTFSESLSPAIAAAVPEAVRHVLDLLLAESPTGDGEGATGDREATAVPTPVSTQRA